MATLFKADGTQEEISPCLFQFDDYELKQYLQGDWYAHYFVDNPELIVINPDGLSDGLPLNIRATEYLRKRGLQTSVYGNAIVCESVLIA